MRADNASEKSEPSRGAFNEFIVAFATQAVSETDMDNLLEQAVVCLARVWPADFVSIESVSENGKLLRLVAGAGWRPELIGTHLTRTSLRSGGGVALESRRPEVISRGPKTAWTTKAISGTAGLRQSVYAKIPVGTHRYGVIGAHMREIGDVSGSQLGAIAMVAQILGAAIARVEAEVTLRDRERRLDLAVRGSYDGIWDWDIVTGHIYLSSRVRSILGLDEHEGAPKSPATWPETLMARVHPEDRESFRSALRTHLKGESPLLSSEHRILRADGAYRWIRARGLAVRDPSGRAIRIAGSISDIDERKNNEHRLLKDALHDPLTGLPNRALFTDRVTQAMARTARSASHLFAVLYLDFDHFKQVNDTLGHTYGDRMLIEISHRLRECIREMDTVARLGGDEFAILLESLESEATAEDVARRINARMGIPIRLAGRDVVSNVSIGIAFASLGYSRPEDIIHDADVAMYRAKTTGRARHVVFEKGMEVRAGDEIALETELRRAIDEGQFQLDYHPVFKVKTGELAGFEALLRWHHPDKGFIPAADFISVAEETKLIVPIGTFVLHEVCRQIRRWHAKYPTRALHVSINLSPQQFNDPAVVDHVRAAMEENNLPRGALCLEITESAIMTNPLEVIERLRQLKQLGVQIHIDDFGTGFSSLSYLHRFPIDALKIDRSFIGVMGQARDNLEIVGTIIALAHNLKLKTVAEGVESSTDLDELKKLGCDFAQGYHFSIPLDVNKATAYIATH